MKSRVWKRIQIGLVGPSCRKLAGQELLAVNGYAVPLGGQLVGEDGDDQYFDLVDTPVALGVRNAKLMMVDLQLAVARLDVDEKRGEGGAPHLG